jgi:hypothetical protein
MNQKWNLKKLEDVPNQRPQGTVGFTVNSFPSTLWVEWDKDCKENFGDCRWIKMWSDHKIALSLKFLEKVCLELDDRLSLIEQKLSEPVIKSKKIETLGGSVNDGGV